MVGGSGEDMLDELDADNPFDNPDFDAALLEHRTLLDMELEVRHDIAYIERRVGVPLNVKPRGLHRITQRVAARIRGSREFMFGQRADPRTRAEQAQVRALLVD